MTTSAGAVSESVGDGTLANRHAGTLGGRLAPLGSVPLGHVELVVSRTSASCRVGQLLATHAANLIGRLEGVVLSVSVVVEDGDVALLKTIDPREPLGGRSLIAAIARASTLASASRFSVITPPASEKLRLIRVGIGQPKTRCDLYVAAGSWGAALGSSPVGECQPKAQGAIGSLTAASFAAAEVFRILRVLGRYSARTTSLIFDTWSWSSCESIFAADLLAPEPWGRLLRETTVAGVGAVGCAMLYTIWASGMGLVASLVDGDLVDLTNLNRYILFELADIDASKAKRAAALLRRGEVNRGPGAIRLAPTLGWWSDYVRNSGNLLRKLVVSGVDKNTARHQLQDSLPALILGASTLGFRLEVASYDLRAPLSRCLKCFNRPEVVEPDMLLQKRLLALDESSLQSHARESDVLPAVLAKYVAELKGGGNGCAVLAGPALDRLRHDTTENTFAISFVSSMAGVQLATQLFRESIGEPLLIAPFNRAIFQFLNPTAESNRVFCAPRDPDCWCADPIVREAYTGSWQV